LAAKYIVTGIGARELEKGATVVYEKWIKRKEKPLPGSLVEIETPGGYTACGLWDGAGHVGVRVLHEGGCQSTDPLDAVLMNLEKALRLRERIGLASPSHGFRLVNSDGDYLSGLIVDVYNEIAVVQSSSLAFDVHLKDIASWLTRELGVHHVYEKSIQRSRRDIGLQLRRRWLRGGGREETIIEENGVKFIVNVVEGQKTGFFLDQRANRAEFGGYAGKGDTVLDVFSYTGGFGLHAAYNGASKLVFIEEDPLAVRLLKRNLELNGIRKYSIIEESVWNAIKRMRDSFNLVSVDPPAFIQRPGKEAFRKGVSAYRAVYEFGVNTASPGAGMVYLSSCSYFLKRSDFMDLIKTVTARKSARILGSLRGADRDHVIGTAGYLEYLKGAFIAL
jgi:23S rRNA (cytosine1962-C5)-methyltransferase